MPGSMLLTLSPVTQADMLKLIFPRIRGHLVKLHSPVSQIRLESESREPNGAATNCKTLRCR